MAEEFDLVVTGGSIVTSREVIPATVAVRNGRVAGVLDATERPAAEDHVDASGLHILPGIIDTHVHLRDPGRPEREDFVSGTSAAAAGGVTTIIEMPISEPPVNSGEVLAHRAEQVQPRALVDYALYGAAGLDNPDQIAAMAEAGAIAFKTFLHAPIPSREHEFVGLTCTDEGALREIMVATAETGLLHCFHCENNAMLEHLEEKLRAAGRTDGMAHAESRPPVVEDAAVAEMLAIAAETGGRVQVVHMSSPLAAQLVSEAKTRGVRATAETCPQYLFLTYDALREHGPYAKCNPALRSAATVEEFWEYLRDGTIDVVGSDHSPFLDAEKAKGLEDIFLAPAGLPGLEPMLPLMLDAVNEGRLSPPAVARLMSERAAELFGLPEKGRVEPGADADLALVDMNAEWTFDSGRSFSKAGGNMRAYDGRRLKGRVVSTFVRGELVFHEGEITASPGHGRFLRPVSVKERTMG
jgi:dihydropyrimidinase/allantoinase